MGGERGEKPRAAWLYLCAMRSCVFVALLAVVSAVQVVRMPEPKTALPVNDPSIKWEAVTPQTHDVTEMLLQEEEGTSLSVTPSTAISCSVETGCTCKAQYYYGHIETADCAVYVPEQYHSDQFSCQYFIQGGALFLYGNKWKKAVEDSAGPMAGDTYFCN